VLLYSSAVFAFSPEIALAFHKALTSGDDATANKLIDGFYRPLVNLRNQGRGYAVSLVKAGVPVARPGGRRGTPAAVRALALAHQGAQRAHRHGLSLVHELSLVADAAELSAGDGRPVGDG